jgi:hypothetical protein
MAGAASMMCSYSRSATPHLIFVSDASQDLINGTFACENDKIMNGIVKAEHGFRGCKYFLSCVVLAPLKFQFSQLSCLIGQRKPFLSTQVIRRSQLAPRTESTIGAATGLDVF